MKTLSLGNSSLVSSRLAYGCWRIAGKESVTDCEARGRKAVIAAYEAGYTLFDHADIYGQGRAEAIFGQVLKEASGMRDRVLLATKCGIRPCGDPAIGAPYRYDIINPDGTDRPTTVVLREYAEQITRPRNIPRPNVWIEFNPDSPAGIEGIYKKASSKFWQAVDSGKVPGLRPGGRKRAALGGGTSPRGTDRWLLLRAWRVKLE